MGNKVEKFYARKHPKLYQEMLKLRHKNPGKKFRISICVSTQETVIQNWHSEDKTWICLH